MSENNKRPPGYVPLTIHELAAGQKGKRGTAFDYVFSLDARAVDDSVLSSSAARAAVGQPRNGGRPHGERQEGGFGGQQGRGRRGNRRGRNRRNFSGDGDGSANWSENAEGGAAEGSSGQESGAAESAMAAPQEDI